MSSSHLTSPPADAPASLASLPARLGHLTQRSAAVVAALFLWWLVTAMGWVSPDSVPGPGAVVGQFMTLARQGYSGVPLETHIWASLTRTLIGFSLAVLLGVPIGLLLGYYETLDRAVTPLLSFIRPIPPIAYAPLMVLYFGIGGTSKVVLIFIGGFLYLLLSTQSGVRSVPDLLIRAGLNAGLSKPQLFFKVIFPGALPGIMTGVRTGLAVSWALVVAAELISAQEGLGFMVANAATFFDIKTIFVGIFLIGVFGAILDLVVVSIQRKLLHWEGK